MNKLLHLIDRLRTNFWLVPMALVGGSLALAVVLVDAHSTETARWLEQWPRVFGASAEGARGILSTIAGSMMTVVGVTFSMTLVALTLASDQFSSRILRNFMRDRVTQFVLGSFAGIFVYCLTVLRTIRSGPDDAVFIPGLAVTVSVVLAVFSVGVLIFFIHHVAASIRASTIIAEVATETYAAIHRLHPDTAEDTSTPGHRTEATYQAEPWHMVTASSDGYLETLDDDALLQLACEHNTVIRTAHAVGDFIVAGGPLVAVAMHDAPNAKLTEALQGTHVVGRHRTLQQDIAFGIRQIVDIALRALSPGVNDTTTAVTCIDYLSAIVARLAARTFPPANRYHEGELRVVLKAYAFADFLNGAFDQMRESAKGNAAMILRMLGALAAIGELTNDPERRSALQEHVRELADLASRTLESKRDRQRLDERATQVHATLTLAT